MTTRLTSHSVQDRPERISLNWAGCWTKDELDRSLTGLAATICATRNAGRPVAVLCDISAAAVHTAEVSDQIALFASANYLPGDRVAFVGASALMKLQLKRVMKPASMEAFASHQEAIAWLERAN